MNHPIPDPPNGRVEHVGDLTRSRSSAVSPFVPVRPSSAPVQPSSRPGPACPLLIALLLMVLPLLATQRATGQRAMPARDIRPDLYAELEDGSALYRIRPNGDTIPVEWACATYDFIMRNDSASRTIYTITGFKRNGYRLPLHHWKSWRTFSTDAEELSSESRTDDVTLIAGDTLSFYRELLWEDRRPAAADSMAVPASDTLSYSVELVRSSDGSRMVLLDSMGAIPCTHSTGPGVYGDRPIMALVRFGVPLRFSATIAYLRVNVYRNGKGSGKFMRRETPTVALWRKLNNSYWVNYLGQWGQLFAQTHSERPDTTGNIGRLAVRRSWYASSVAVIEFSENEAGGSTCVAISDVYGRILYYPFATSASEACERVMMHRFDESGTYLVNLFYDGRLVKSASVVVSR
ncbi:MAG: hypothetical protein JST22_10755 [Bacteroidetes bacterium]|nr:hypothetical protein [Bacteroidota bacterium]